MKKLFLILGILSVFGSGCIAECERWESLPVKVAAVEEYEIKAIEEINEVFGTEIFSIDPDGVPIYYVKLGDPKLGTAAAKAYRHCSGGVISSGEIYVTEVYHAGLGIRNVVAHELFHILGFMGHTKDGLMQTIVPFGPRDLKGPLSDLITEEIYSWFDNTYPEESTQ